MQGGIHRAVVQDFCRAAPQSADYGFSSIVIERDPANHWRNSRDERASLGPASSPLYLEMAFSGSSFHRLTAADSFISLVRPVSTN